MSGPIEDVLGLKTAASVAAPIRTADPLSASARVFLRVFLWFLAASALLGMVSILSGDFGDFELKVLGTTLTISLGSLCAMCCLKCGQQRDLASWSQLGVALTAAAAVMLIVGLWINTDADGYWKLSAIMAIAAAANAHVCALFFARLSPDHAWLQTVAALVIASLALLLATAVAAGFDHTAPFKLIAMLAVLDLGLTIAVPILHRLDQPAVTAAAEMLPAAGLQVTPNSDGSYSLPDGRRLVLKENSQAEQQRDIS